MHSFSSLAEEEPEMDSRGLDDSWRSRRSGDASQP
jgi:hypothetical protein